MSTEQNTYLDTYETLMQVTWNFDYQGSVQKLDDLYNRAKDNQWNATDLDWDTHIDPSNPIVASTNTDYARMPFFFAPVRSTERIVYRSLHRAGTFTVLAW